MSNTSRCRAALETHAAVEQRAIGPNYESPGIGLRLCLKALTSFRYFYERSTHNRRDTCAIALEWRGFSHFFCLAAIVLVHPGAQGRRGEPTPMRLNLPSGLESRIARLYTHASYPARTQTVIHSAFMGTQIDFAAPAGSLVTTVGVERDGPGENRLVLTTSMLNPATAESKPGCTLRRFSR